MSSKDRKYRFRILSAVPCGHFELNKNGRYRHVNPVFEEMLGYSEGELLGKRFHEVFPKELRKEAKRVIATVLEGEPSQIESNHLHKDGSIGRHNMVLRPIVENGSVVGVEGFVDDITKREEELAVLAESEEKFRSLVERANDGICIIQDYEMRYVNPRLCKMLDMKAEDIVGTRFMNYIAPEERDKIVARYKKRMEGEEVPSVYETMILRSDGTRLNAEFNAGVSTYHGEPADFVIVRDITQRKRNEKALRESEERYRNLFENSILGIYRTTPDGRIVMANPALLSMLGYSSLEEIAAHNLEDEVFFGPDYPRELFKKEVEQKGKVSGLESVWLTKDGKKVFVRENARAVRDENGEVAYYEGTVEDITKSKLAEQKVLESETRYRALFEQATEAVFIESVDGIILDVNRRVKDILGFEKEELIGEPISKIIPEAEAAKLRVHFKELASGHGFSIESYNLHKDGHEVPVEVSAMPVEVAGERFTMAFVRDITERRRLEEQLRLSQKLEALGRLAGGIAHDFNNLITGIFGYIDLMKLSMSPDDPNAASVKDIENIAKKATSLTKQLLAFSRKQFLKPENLDLNEVIGDMAGMLERVIGETITFKFKPQENLPPIKADRSQIEQVIMNLVINAEDAIDDGGNIQIETKLVVFDEDYVHAHPEASFGKHVMLAVSDTGCGIKKEDISRIFEPFFTTKKAGIGTGLGLPMVYGVVKQTGGHIFVYSEPNKGTTFKLYFPVVLESQDANVAAPDDDPVDGDETILVVDDDPDVRKAIINALSHNGYRVLEAADGREALELLETLEGPLHLIISDVVMPKLGGRDLVEIVRDIYPGIKIIYISGYPDKAVAEPGLEGAAGEFIAKPFSAESLVKKVRELLDS